MLLKEIFIPSTDRQQEAPVVPFKASRTILSPIPIKHSGARTRALYRWENEEFYSTPAGSKKLTEKQLNELAQKIWSAEGWDRYFKCPSIRRDDKMKELSYTYGRAEIILNFKDANAVILIHELTHARGHGTAQLMHPVGFVKVYIRLLGKYLSWDVNELTEKATQRGLI